MRIRVQILQMTLKVGTFNFPVVHQGLKFKISLGSDDLDGHSEDDPIAADSQPAVEHLRPIPIGLPDHMLATLGEYIVNKFRKPLEIQLLGNDSDLESDGKKEGDDQPAVAQLRPIPIGLPDHMLASLGEYIVNKFGKPLDIKLLGNDSDLESDGKEWEHGEPAVTEVRPIPIGMPEHMLADLGAYLVHKQMDNLNIKLLGDESDLDYGKEKNGGSSDEPAVAAVRPIPIALPENILAALGA